MRTELVTTLKRQATELLSDIERDKQPILITLHGLPSAYLVDAETFEPAAIRGQLRNTFLYRSDKGAVHPGPFDSTNAVLDA